MCESGAALARRAVDPPDANARASRPPSWNRQPNARIIASGRATSLHKRRGLARFAVTHPSPAGRASQLPPSCPHRAAGRRAFFHRCMSQQRASRHGTCLVTVGATAPNLLSAGWPGVLLTGCAGLLAPCGNPSSDRANLPLISLNNPPAFGQSLGPAFPAADSDTNATQPRPRGGLSELIVITKCYDRHQLTRAKPKLMVPL
jgi:hypothetical protein